MTLREGERRRGYNVGKYQSVRNERFPNRYTADITFERMEQQDFDSNALHLLKVKSLKVVPKIFRMNFQISFNIQFTTISKI